MIIFDNINKDDLEYEISRFLESHTINELLEVLNKYSIKNNEDTLIFVIHDNSRIISLLDPVVNWVTRPGSTVNGVKLDYGYGIMTSGDVKVQVVSIHKEG